VLGGGQLGRMMIQAAVDLDVGLEILDGSRDAPCSKLSTRFVVGDIRIADTVEAFGEGLDILTIEIEDVSVEGMARLEKKGVRVVPKSKHVALIQDKGLQKQFFAERGIPTAPFVLSSDPSAMGFPVVQKLRRGGFDGRGVQVLHSKDDLQKCFPGECLLENKVAILKEVSVVIARRDHHDIKAFPPCEAVFDERANVALYMVAPAELEPLVAEKCLTITTKLVQELDYIGLLCVELFVVDNEEKSVLVNEIAPRCHNSGHHTIEANATSQFSQLLRVALDLPLGDVRPTRPAAATLNILGDHDTPKGSPTYRGIEAALADQDVTVYPHLYGKSSVSPFRKMGHVTVVGDCRGTVIAKVLQLRDSLGCRAAVDLNS